MALISDLVHQTTASSGTGDLTLIAANGKQTFAGAFGTGGTDRFWYFISSQSAVEYEVGTGHMSDATTLVRDTVHASSNGGALVNFTSGLKDVANDLPASVQHWIANSYQQTLTSVGVIAMQLADTMNFAQFPSQDRFSDSFDDLTFVDVAGATNLDTSSPGVLRPTVSDARISDATASNPIGNAATVANTNDNNPATTSTWTGQNLNGQTVANRRIWQLDLGSVRAITKVEVKQLRCALSTTLNNNAIYTSTDGTTWAIYGAPITLTGVAADTTRTVSRSARYVAYVAEETGYAGGYNVILGDLNVYAPGSANDMAVSTTGLPLIGEPDVMHGLLLAQHDVGVTPNTDFNIDFSRNNGVNWASSTLTLLRHVPIPGGTALKLYSTNYVDVTGHAFATAARIRMRTSNGKATEFHSLFTYGLIGP